MKTKQMSPRKKWLIAGGIVLLILAILVGVFFWYVSDYYRAEDAALDVMAQDSGITVQDNLTILSPTYPTDTGLPSSAGSDPTDRSHLHLGRYALPHGDF